MEDSLHRIRSNLFVYLVTTEGMTKEASRKYAVELVEKYKEEIYKDKDTPRYVQDKLMQFEKVDSSKHANRNAAILQLSCQTTTTTSRTSAWTTRSAQTQLGAEDVVEVVDGRGRGRGLRGALRVRL
jgi:hypothetical protein